MDHQYCNRDRRYGKYLTESDRFKLEALLKASIPKNEIAVQLGKSLRTINREINRGQVINVDSLWREKLVYSAEYSQQMYMHRVSNKGPALKIGRDHKLAEHIEKKIKRDKIGRASCRERV